MEKFMKDTAEVMAAKNANTDSLKNIILCDTRLMNELHALGFADSAVDGYLSVLATYLDQRDAEEDPTHSKEAPYPGMKMTLTVDDSGYLSFVLGPNEQNKNKQLLEANFLYRDYPEEWMTLTPQVLKGVRFKEIREAIKMMGKAAKNWIYIQGEPASGKSYFLAALLNNFAVKGKTVCFMNTNQRFEELKALAIKKPQEFNAIMAQLKTCDHLVLDDFGNEYRSDYVRDTILMPLLNDRSRLGLKTYITSQYSIDEIEELYGRGSRIDGRRVTSIIKRNIKDVVYLTKGIESTLSSKR